MKVTLSSIFRNSVDYLDRYFDQIERVRAAGMEVRLVLGEGDSNDATGSVLRERVGPDDTVITVNHGGENYGSIDHPARWQNIAKVVSAVIAEVGDPGDAFVYVESDLGWRPERILSLLEADRCVAPMVMNADGLRFYDTWGFRQGGHVFKDAPPYAPSPSIGERYLKIDSCGNCFVVPAKHFEVVEQWDGMWPFTADGLLWLDTQVHVRHP